MTGPTSRRTLLAAVGGACGLLAGCVEQAPELARDDPDRTSTLPPMSEERPTCASTDAAQLVVVRPRGALVTIEETFERTRAANEARTRFERSVPDGVEVQLRAFDDPEETRQSDSGKRTGGDANVRFLGDVSVSTARTAVEDAGYTVVRAHPGVSKRMAASMRAGLENRITELSEYRDVSGRDVSLAIADDGAPLLVASFADPQDRVRRVLRVGGHVRIEYAIDGRTELTATYGDIAEFGLNAQGNEFYVAVDLSEEFRTRLGDLIRSATPDSVTVSLYYDSAALVDGFSLTSELVDEIAAGTWTGEALFAFRTVSKAKDVLTALERQEFPTPVELSIDSC